MSTTQPPRNASDGFRQVLECRADRDARALSAVRAHLSRVMQLPRTHYRGSQDSFRRPLQRVLRIGVIPVVTVIFTLCLAGCGPTPRSVARTIDPKRVPEVSVRLKNLQSIIERTIGGERLFAGEILAIACNDPDRAVRLAAIDGLARLIEKLPRDFGIDHPLAIHASSGPAFGWHTASELMGLRKDESPEVRLRLANMLAEHDVRITSLIGFDHSSSLKTLEAMAEDEADPKLKSDVLLALGTRLVREAKKGWISQDKARRIAKRYGLDLPEGGAK